MFFSLLLPIKIWKRFQKPEKLKRNLLVSSQSISKLPLKYSAEGGCPVRVRGFKSHPPYNSSYKSVMNSSKDVLIESSTIRMKAEGKS